MKSLLFTLSKCDYKPKAERIRIKAHPAAAKPKPSGDLQSSSIPDLLSPQGIEEKPNTVQPTKREKMLERRESFLRSELRKK